MTTDTTDILECMTPTTLAQMYWDAIDAENADLGVAIHEQMAALGADVDALLEMAESGPQRMVEPAPQREPNQAAIDAFLRHIVTSRGYVETITQTLDDHYDTLPEDVDWGHVGNAAHVGDLLRQAVEFITGDEDGALAEEDADGYIDGYDGPSRTAHIENADDDFGHDGFSGTAIDDTDEDYF